MPTAAPPQPTPTPAPTPAPLPSIAPTVPVSAAPRRGSMRSGAGRSRRDRVFVVVCVAAAAVAIGVLITMLTSIAWTGVGWLDLAFLSSFASPVAEEAGIFPALLGSLYVCGICALTAIPLGVGTALLLEEFRPRHPLLRRLHGFVQINISNLAGVPSIVYGILGVTVFVNMFGLIGAAGDSGFALGQRWFDQYTDGAGRSYFVAADGPAGDGNGLPGTQPGAQADLAYFTDTDLATPAAGLTFLTDAETAPRRAALKTDMRAFDRTYRKAINATRSGARNRGPAAIDDATAAAVVDEAIAAATFKSDIGAIRPELIALTRSMDGLESRELRGPRTEALDLATQQEERHRLAGVMTVGAEPIRVDRRSWYYLTVPFGRSILAGGLTLMLVILPVIIIASQEALRAVPESMRHGSLALGGTRWQSVSKIALPAAIPGICTGTILAMSRAIGEAAPLLILAGVVFISFTPANLMDNFTVMPLQIFDWSARPQEAFHHVAAAGIIVLLAVLLTFNAVAVVIRQKTTR